MKKVANNIDNPIDTLLVDFFDKFLSNFFKKTGHTPNTLTTYSLITGLISCYFLNLKKLVLFSVFYTISYFFDCADGFFARKYSMTSDIGDIYDHVKDSSVGLLILYITFKNSRKNINSYVISIFLIFYGLLLYYMSCQENNCDDKFKNKNNGTLKFLNNLCKDRVDNIKWVRHFGPGTFNLFFIIIICYVNRN
jgi:hypothetical protein